MCHSMEEENNGVVRYRVCYCSSAHRLRLHTGTLDNAI